MRFVFSFFILILTTGFLKSQMVDGESFKYGNEWIDLSSQYYKIPIAEDGIYRISQQQLVAAGIPANTIPGSQYQIYLYGEEIPLFTTTAGIFSAGDYIEFYGEKNRSQLDKYLFRNRDHILNPEYSMFTDTASYFLSWTAGNGSGKRYTELSNDLPASPPEPKQYYIHLEKLVFDSDFIKPLRDPGNVVYRSSFDIGEGFGSRLQVENSFTINTSHYINSGVNPELNLRFATNIGRHQIEFRVNNELKKIYGQNGLNCDVMNIPLQSSDIKSSIPVRITGTDDSDFLDRNSVSVVTLSYSRAFKFQNMPFFRFNIEKSDFTDFIEIEEFDMQGSNFVLYDINNNTRLIPVSEGGKLKFVIGPSVAERQFVLVNLDKIAQSVSGMQKMEFKDYSQYYDRNYLVITDRSRFYDESQINWVDEYIRYRESPEGGSMKALVVNVQDIYDQFGYGIHRHAQGFNNFAIYYADHFINPEYIFIIGKGLEYHVLRTEENLAANRDLLIVPTYGFPGADNLIAARYEKNHPAIAIGRIAARSHEDIKIYLGKIKRYDSYRSLPQNLEDRMWMKKVIHLVGGSDPSEVSSIRTLMNLMANSIKNGKFAPDVVTYERTSGTAQETVSEKIIKDIEDGAAIVTFFGHSSVTGDDFKVTRLNNEKLPVFFSLGCYSGNIHTTVSGGQSEFFIFDDNFMISYAGTSGTGFISALSNTGRTLYDLISNELYGSGLGKVMQRALQINDNNNSDAIVTLNQQFTLHGDPALSIYAHEGPDFVIDYSTLRTEPSVISANDKDFKLVFDIVNIGLQVNDSLEVRLIRTLPEGRRDTLNALFKAPIARQSYEITLNTNQTEGTGENCIAMFLNPERKIPEAPDPAAFNNNTLRDQNGENRFCFFIINNGIRPVYPSEFSIVNKPDLDLIASTFNYYVENEKYIFQIDTTELFNSMLMRSNVIETNGGLVSWKPNITMEENTVYYWRVSPDSTGPETPFVWTNSSFIYLPESSEGWNQSHYYQWLKDEFNDLEFNEGRLDFSKWLRDFNFEIGALDPTNPNMVRRDGSTIGGLRPPLSLVPCVVLVAYGPRVDFYRNVSGSDYGSKQWRPTSFIYKTDNLDNRKGIKDAIEAFPDSSMVFFYTYANGEIHSLHTEEWEEDSIQLGYNIFSVLESNGAEFARLLKTRGTVPYLFVFKKGGERIFEDIGKSPNSLISVSIPMPERNWSGSLSSTIVGPAKEWNSVVWDESGREAGDVSTVNVFKYNSELAGKQLIGSLNSDYELDISDINPQEFPYLQLELQLEDTEVSRTTPDFNYWRVLYEGFPDAALVQDEHALFHSDTLEFGDIFRFRSGVINHTPIDMDSLLVRYRIRKQNNEEITVMKRYAPLKGGQGYNIDFEYPTRELAGMNEFTVEINADREQTEKYYFNNTGIRRFLVRQDKRNPLLDVTFDGIHIMDGDIINPSPAIRIMVRDDNKFLLLDDIGIFRQLNLISPSGNMTEVALLNNSEIEFMPAQSVSDNRAYLNFSPEFLEEGEYKMIVQTSDVSGNMSGSIEYRISFQVILKEQISDVYNYPNPFSTRTRFVFTLTGQETPEDIVIRIMTLSGKIVRELTTIDLGTFRIGQNMTEKYWDGTDEFGSLLANGVYLYQVTAVNSAGKKFDKMETRSDTDRFFKEGFGKLVILR